MGALEASPARDGDHHTSGARTADSPPGPVVLLDYRHAHITRRLTQPLRGLAGIAILLLGCVALTLLAVPFLVGLLGIGMAIGTGEYQHVGDALRLVPDVMLFLTRLVLTVTAPDGRALLAPPTTLSALPSVTTRIEAIVAAAAAYSLRDLDAWIVVAWCMLTLTALQAVRHGPRLVRGERTLVLFLRRFGYAEATRSVSYAVRKTVGSSWRLVTLDDAAIAPVGPGTSYVTGAERGLSALIGTAAKLVLQLGKLAVVGMLAIVLMEVARGSRMWTAGSLEILPGFVVGSDGVPHMSNDGIFLDRNFVGIELRDVVVLELPLDVFFQYVKLWVDAWTQVFSFQFNLDAIGFDLPSVFTLLAMYVGLMFPALFVGFFAMFVWMFVLPTWLVLFTSLSEAEQRAEGATTMHIRTNSDISRVAWQSLASSRGIFAPKLAVVRVETDALWQETVEELAKRASVSLIDVSQPTENVLWELNALIDDGRTRCLLVGQQARLAEFSAAPPDSIQGRLAAVLAGREVLAYTSDGRGTRRFAHALHAKLCALTDAAR